MTRKILQNLVEVRHRLIEGQHRRPIAPTDEEGPRVPQDTIHMTDKFMRRTNLATRTKLGKIRRSIAKSLLRSISKRRQKMPQHHPLLIHT